MQTKPLGSQGLHAARIGLGCMGMSDFYGSRNDDESVRVMHRAYELGVTFFDTADMYGPYTNEVLVGKAIRPFRNNIVLATKFGIVRDPENPTKRGFNGKPDYVQTSCEGSLKRLGVETIEFTLQIIDTFINNGRETLKEIEAAFTDSRIAAVYELAHRMKSSAGMLGAAKLLALLHEIETEARNEGKDKAKLKTYICQAQAQFDKVSDGLEKAKEEVAVWNDPV